MMNFRVVQVGFSSSERTPKKWALNAINEMIQMVPLLM